MNTLGGLRVLSATLFAPFGGVWFADVVLDLDDGEALPTGRTVLTIGDRPCVCTVDPRFSGSFGQRHAVRVLGGGGGWHTEVPAQHYHNDGGVLLSAVATTTGLAAGEVVSVRTEARLGVDFVRAKERASRVLDGVAWWVGLDGVTVIGERLETPVPPALGAEVLEWDPAAQVATVSLDGLLEPGTTLEDPRFGRLVARDVEHVVTPDGFRARVWCGPSQGARLRSALARLAAEASGSVWTRCYRYRVVLDTGDRLALQAIREAPGLPDLLPVSVWYGAPGISAVMQPGAEVLVEFLEGDPAQPVVRAFEPAEGAGFLPIVLTLDALTLVKVGTVPFPVSHAVETLASFVAISTALSSISSALADPTKTANNLKWGELAGIVGPAVTTMIGSLVAAATTLPTTKLVAE